LYENELVPVVRIVVGRAQINLGLLYARGDGVAKDRKEAARWSRLAAAQGYAQAQVYLGGGDGVEKNLDEAAVWLRKAADQGSLRAKNYLEQLTLNGSAGL